MSTEVCPFCGKAFKRLKSHLPHCKANSSLQTPTKIAEVTSHQTPPQLSADASKSIAKTKKSKQTTLTKSPDAALSLKTKPVPKQSYSNSLSLSRKEHVIESDQIVSGLNPDKRLLVSTPASRGADDPDLTPNKLKAKKKSLRALKEVAKSGHVTEASPSEDLVSGLTLQTRTEAKQLTHKETSARPEGRFLSEILHSEDKNKRLSKNKGVVKSSQVPTVSEDPSGVTSDLSEDGSYPVSSGSSKKSKKVSQLQQDLVSVSTEGPVKLPARTSKSRSKTKPPDDSSKSHDLFLNHQHTLKNTSTEVSGLTLEPIQEILNEDFSKDEAQPTRLIVKAKYVAKKKSLPSEATPSKVQDLVSTSSQGTSVLVATHDLGTPDIKLKRKKSLRALESGDQDHHHHPLLPNKGVESEDTFGSSNQSLTEASKLKSISKKSLTQSLSKSSMLSTNSDPPQECATNGCPAVPQNFEKETSHEASTEESLEWSPQARITIQSLTSTLGRHKPRRSILQDIGINHGSDQLYGGHVERSMSDHQPSSQPKNISNLTAQSQCTGTEDAKCRSGLRTTGIQTGATSFAPDAARPLVPRGDHGAAIRATKGLMEKPLADVRLKELPNWLVHNTPVHPRAVVEVLQRGRWWYYRKYFDVKKGGVGGISMLLAGYCTISYIWNYPHLKHERWRKYH